MDLLIVYIAIGVLALVGIGIDAYVRRTKNRSDLSNLIDQLRRDRQSWSQSILERFVLPIITGVAIVAFWPAAIAFAIHFYRRKDQVAGTIEEFEPKQFIVQRADLIECIAIGEIESKEFVHDPLHSVPEVPFGHLNPAWTEFRRKIEASDEIWSYQSEWGKYGHPTELRVGYAALRHGSIVAHFVKVILPLETSSQKNRRLSSKGDL